MPLPIVDVWCTLTRQPRKGFAFPTAPNWPATDPYPPGVSQGWLYYFLSQPVGTRLTPCQVSHAELLRTVAGVLVHVVSGAAVLQDIVDFEVDAASIQAPGHLIQL